MKKKLFKNLQDKKEGEQKYEEDHKQNQESYQQLQNYQNEYSNNYQSQNFNNNRLEPQIPKKPGTMIQSKNEMFK